MIMNLVLIAPYASSDVRITRGIEIDQVLRPLYRKKTMRFGPVNKYFDRYISLNMRLGVMRLDTPEYYGCI